MNWRWIVGGITAAVVLLGGAWLEYKFSVVRAGWPVLTSDKPLSQLARLKGSSGPAVSFKNDIGHQNRGYISGVDRSAREISLLTGQGLETYAYDENSRWLFLPAYMPDAKGNPVAVDQTLIDTGRMVLPEEKFSDHSKELSQGGQAILSTGYRYQDEELSEITRLVIGIGCGQ